METLSRIKHINRANFQERRRHRVYDDHHDHLDPEYQSQEFEREFCLTEFIQSTNLTTEVLRSQLLPYSLDKPWLLEQSDIFQRATLNLASGIFKTPLPDYLRQSSLRELMELIEGINKILTGEAKKAKINQTDSNLDINYYFDNSLGEPKRLVAFLNLIPGYSEHAKRKISSFCQLQVKDILGKSHRGRAIAGDDSRIRCGLRPASLLNNRRWSVSIDSGVDKWDLGIDSILHKRSWRSIRPLSQAIKVAREHPESEIDPDDPTIYTYHFYDEIMKDKDPDMNRLKFTEFNRYLSEILLNN